MKSRFKHFLSNLVTVLLVIAGVFFFLVMTYPFWSDWYNRLRAHRSITNYAQAVTKYNDATVEKMWKEALLYNQRIAAEGTGIHDLSPSEEEEYNSLLDSAGTGIMGSLEIPSINVSLPIYHGTSESVLMVGIGHLEGSSLPVGGSGSHCVLTGHTGMPSAELLTNLSKVEVGDQFSIIVLNRTLTYSVDQIEVVLPTEVRDLEPVPGKDYVTLVTCTPYGVNSHRLLVRGHRVETVVKKMGELYPNPEREMLVTDIQLALPFAVSVAVVVVITRVIFYFQRRKRRRRKAAQGKKER